MQWQDRIGANPNVCHGKPCIEGTRVIVSNLASSEAFPSILQDRLLAAE